MIITFTSQRKPVWNGVTFISKGEGISNVIVFASS